MLQPPCAVSKCAPPHQQPGSAQAPAFPVPLSQPNHSPPRLSFPDPLSPAAQAGYPVCLLSEQYRMHPAISAWPSSYFYEGRLLDAPGVAAGSGGGGGGGGRAAPWHATLCFPPLAFYDCLEVRAVPALAMEGGCVRSISRKLLVHLMPSCLMPSCMACT